MNKAINPSSDDASASRQEERGKLSEHPVRMTQHRSRCGISRFESFTGASSSRCASVLTRASQADSQKWISTCNRAWSLWRWSHSESDGGFWVVTMHALPNLFAARALFSINTRPHRCTWPLTPWCAIDYRATRLVTPSNRHRTLR